MNDRQQRALDEVSRDLDLLVYRLERPAPAEPDEVRDAWRELHRRLERLRDRVDELLRDG